MSNTVSRQLQGNKPHNTSHNQIDNALCFCRAQTRCQPGCEKSQTKEPQERGANCPECKPAFWFHIKLPAKAAQYNKSIQVNMRIQPGHCQHGGDNFPSALLHDFGAG